MAVLDLVLQQITSESESKFSIVHKYNLTSQSMVEDKWIEGSKGLK